MINRDWKSKEKIYFPSGYVDINLDTVFDNKTLNDVCEYFNSLQSLTVDAHIEFDVVHTYDGNEVGYSIYQLENDKEHKNRLAQVAECERVEEETRLANIAKQAEVNQKKALKSLKSKADRKAMYETLKQEFGDV